MAEKLNRVALALVAIILAAPMSALGQDTTFEQEDSGSPDAATTNYVPIDGRLRIHWTINGIGGPRSLAVGVVAAGWQTMWNDPEEWRQTWEGFDNRYLARLVDVSISNTMEAGLGALWGEEPRYIPSHRHEVWARVRYSVKTVFLAQRPDGRLEPAWARYAANTVNNLIENAWLPPSITGVRGTAIRSAEGFAGRLAGNLFEEFWPDARALLRRRR